MKLLKIIIFLIFATNCFCEYVSWIDVFKEVINTGVIFPAAPLPSCSNLNCIYGKCAPLNYCECFDGFEGIKCDRKIASTTTSSSPDDDSIAEYDTVQPIEISTTESLPEVTTVTQLPETTSEVVQITESIDEILTSSTPNVTKTTDSESETLQATEMTDSEYDVPLNATESPSSTAETFVPSNESTVIIESTTTPSTTTTTLPILVPSTSTEFSSTTHIAEVSSTTSSTIDDSTTIPSTETLETTPEYATESFEILSTTPESPSTEAPPKCPFHDYCAKVSQNGICDLRCNIEECSFDSGDCEDSEVCPQSCIQKAGNGICDEECNLEVCDFDGTDCSTTPLPEESESTPLPKEAKESESTEKLQIVYWIPPSDFNEAVAEELLEKLSSFSQIPNIQISTSDSGAYEIYEWSSENGRGEPIFSGETMAQIKYDSVEILYNVDFAECRSEDAKCKFENANEIEEYIKATSDSEVTSEFGAPIYEAQVVRPEKKEDSGIAFVFGTIFVAFFVVVGAVNGVQHQRKRRNADPNENDVQKRPRMAPHPNAIQNYNDDTPAPQTFAELYHLMRQKRTCEAQLFQWLQNLYNVQGNLEWRTRNGETLLHWCIHLNHYQMAHWMLDKIENANAPDSYGNTLLADCIKENPGALQFFERLLSIPGIEVNTLFGANETPLKLCAESDSLLPFLKLLCAHPSLNFRLVGLLKSRLCMRQNVLHHAAIRGGLEVIKFLIKTDATKRKSAEKAMLSSLDENGRTPLICAIEAEEWEAAKLLLQHMRPVDLKDGVPVIAVLRRYLNEELLALVNAKLPKEKPESPKKKKKPAAEPWTFSNNSEVAAFMPAYQPAIPQHVPYPLNYQNPYSQQPASTISSPPSSSSSVPLQMTPPQSVEIPIQHNFGGYYQNPNSMLQQSQVPTPALQLPVQDTQQPSTAMPSNTTVPQQQSTANPVQCQNPAAYYQNAILQNQDSTKIVPIQEASNSTYQQQIPNPAITPYHQPQNQWHYPGDQSAAFQNQGYGNYQFSIPQQFDHRSSTQSLAYPAMLNTESTYLQPQAQQWQPDYPQQFYQQQIPQNPPKKRNLKRSNTSIIPLNSEASSSSYQLPQQNQYQIYQQNPSLMNPQQSQYFDNQFYNYEYYSVAATPAAFQPFPQEAFPQQQQQIQQPLQQPQQQIQQPLQQQSHLDQTTSDLSATSTYSEGTSGYVSPGSDFPNQTFDNSVSYS